MISDIYIPTITLLVKYYENEPFHEFVTRELPSCIKDHLPEYIAFRSITYCKDRVIEAWLENVIVTDISLIHHLKKKGAEIESGYFHLQLEADEDLRRKRLPSVDFVLQNLHENYSFISSYHFYLGEEEICKTCKMHTFESNDDEDDELDVPQRYKDLFEGYFYHGRIPDAYSDEIAKMMLLQGRI